jgi:alpha-beta hydrolase superfamily lysophospholipase
MFQPTRHKYSEPGKMSIETEDVYIHNGADVVLHGWRLPSVGQTRGSVVFLHGNAENISSHIGGVYWLPRHGYEVFLFDYRGYGRSTGQVGLDGVMHDAQRMIKYAREHASSADQCVTVLGHSMGGSIAIYALAHLPDKLGVNGLIAISAFSDYHQITRDALASHWLTRPLRWPLSFTVSNRYRPVDAIGKLSPIPVFVLHSEADEIIPKYHAQQLFDSARPPRYQKKLEGTHNEVLALSRNHDRLLEILGALNPTADISTMNGLISTSDRRCGQSKGGANPVKKSQKSGLNSPGEAVQRHTRE